MKPMTKTGANQSVEPTGARHSSGDVTDDPTVFFLVESHSLAPVAHFGRLGVIHIL